MREVPEEIQKKIVIVLKRLTDGKFNRLECRIEIEKLMQEHAFAFAKVVYFDKNDWCIKLTDENSKDVLRYLNSREEKMDYAGIEGSFYGILKGKPFMNNSQFAPTINFEQFKTLLA